MKKKETTQRRFLCTGNFFVPVVVDQDKSLNYEQHNWATKIFRVPIISILNILPGKWERKIFTLFTNHQSLRRRLLRWARTYKALEIIYSVPKQEKIALSDYFWDYFLINPRAVRNRLKLVEREILTAIKRVREQKSEIKLLSLGSGSGRAVIEVLARLNGIAVQAKLVDKSRKAIDFSRGLARNICGLSQIELEWHRDYAQNLEKYCGEFRPDIIEMVGLLDYYPYEQAVDLLSKIYKVLTPGGWLIACNICPNLERPFLTKAVNWPMIYRSPQELAGIVVEAGFPPEHLKIVYEPLKIHALAIAKKII